CSAVAHIDMNTAHGFSETGVCPSESAGQSHTPPDYASSHLREQEVERNYRPLSAVKVESTRRHTLHPARLEPPNLDCGEMREMQQHLPATRSRLQWPASCPMPEGAGQRLAYQNKTVTLVEPPASPFESTNPTGG